MRLVALPAGYCGNREESLRLRFFASLQNDKFYLVSLNNEMNQGNVARLGRRPLQETLQEKRSTGIKPALHKVQAGLRSGKARAARGMTAGKQTRT